MIQINASIEIDAPAQEVWEKLAQLDDVQNWAETVEKSYYSSEQTRGVGAERTCEVKGFGTLQEKIVQWQEGESLTYSVEGMPRVVRRVESNWHLEAITPEKTRVSIAGELETRYGVFGGLMAKYMMKPQMTRLLGSALASFKDYIEQSRSTGRSVAPTLQVHAA